MQPLNEVIWNLENCIKPDTERVCGDCSYGGDDCGVNELMRDALHYLLDYRREQQIFAYDIAKRIMDMRNDPLTWEELCRVDMIGEPVWNSGTRRWMLLIDSANDNTWIDLVNHAGGLEHWIEHDLRKAPLFWKAMVRD